MTTKAKWLIALASAGLLAGGALAIGLFLLDRVPEGRRHLPKYSLEQTDSTHPWYRRTTVKFNSAVYVNDFEDYPIQLAYPVPTHAIGRAPFGNSLVCSIPGQETTDFIAVDCGSEMEANEVFRNVRHPAFDWRHAKFQSMDLAGTTMHVEHRTSNDSALIAEVVRTLRDGTPVELALPDSAITTSVENLRLASRELPGLVFCPAIYKDDAGRVYLAESYGVEYVNRTQKIHARWIPASESFRRWLIMP